jgi:SagB-type dehydrogenase family enzyme
MSDELDQVFVYHQATKHNFHAFARGPGTLDWVTQPDPFRRYQGAPLVELEKVAPGGYPLYYPALLGGHVPPAPLDHHSLSQLLFDSLALSAWKQAGGESWALRVNPSSGNLHPTEGYLICGPVEELCKVPAVCHYAPKEHALEIRAQFPLETWQALTAELPANTLLVGLTSIHWREAWKYGERAFRYCQHDVGHAIAALSIAAAGLGWQASLLDDLGTEQLANLLGVNDPQGGGAEPEHPDCVLAIHPQGEICRTLGLPGAVLDGFAALDWQGTPNQLSRGHVDWSIIVDVAAATIKPPTGGVYDSKAPSERSEVADRDEPLQPVSTAVSLRQIIRQRRSAVAMDGRTGISRDALFDILYKTLPGATPFPTNALPWPPCIHLVLFVHRIQDLEPGLYLLVRASTAQEALQKAMKDEFVWQKPGGCPADMGLYRLMAGDARAVSRQLSCQQAIASDGCFSLGMLADFDVSLGRYGAWFYPRLFWESGAIGQALYLAAEAAGLRGTGIGCFFDDPVHTLLGLDLQTLQYQSLYHFTIGGPVEDMRLTTLPAYSDQ